MSNTAGLGGHPIVAFVATTDAERARTFYRDTLGLKLASDELPFALVFDAGGIMLRVTLVREIKPAPYTVLGWHVPDAAAAARRLAAAGVRLQRYEGLNQDELGIWHAPSGAQVAWFRDPDGNTLSITQF